jgi:hypothetical protein
MKNFSFPLAALFIALASTACAAPGTTDQTLSIRIDSGSSAGVHRVSTSEFAGIVRQMENGRISGTVWVSVNPVTEVALTYGYGCVYFFKVTVTAGESVDGALCLRDPASIVQVWREGQAPFQRVMLYNALLNHQYDWAGDYSLMEIREFFRKMERSGAGANIELRAVVPSVGFRGPLTQVTYLGECKWKSSRLDEMGQVLVSVEVKLCNAGSSILLEPLLLLGPF